jgi:ElaB/YqjD/DUF883 family membrane-anchored ribosome-binding protein
MYLQDNEQVVDELTKLLEEIEETLRDWARQSVTGGWSTHQVEPQQQLANRIAATLYRANKTLGR